MCYIMDMNRLADGLLQRTEKARRFAQDWVSSNVYNGPDPDEGPGEIERLACLMTGDARLQGISGSDIDRAVGDIDDYLAGECAKSRSRTVTDRA